MEDWYNILLIVVCVAAIFGKANKRAKTQVQKRDNADYGMETKETIPSYTVTSTRELRGHGKKGKSRKAGTEEPSAAYVPTTRNELEKQAEPIDTTDNSVDTAKDFNLRDAVIYSEILKPKFDQD